MSLPRYGEYKPSGNGWLGDVPAHWNARRLGYFFYERREKVSDREFPPLSVTKHGVVPQLETAAKTDDGENRKKVIAGDFVINSRSDRKGSAGKATQDGSVSLINTVLRPAAIIDIRFVHHLLRSVPFQEEFYRFGKGIVADLWSTNYSEMRNIVLAMPDVSEQRSIASFLDRETAKIDALIAEQEKLVALLAEKRQATISHAVTRGLDPNAPMKDSCVPWLGEVPAHWEVFSLKRLFRLLTARALEKSRPIALEHVKSWSGELGEGEIDFQGNGVSFESGDILFGKLRPYLAKVHLATAPGEAVGDFHVLRPIAGQLGRFARYQLAESTMINVVSATTFGSKMPRVSWEDMGAFMLPVPPFDEQIAISDELDASGAASQHVAGLATSAVALLKERRSALIAAAVTGQIDVRGTVQETAAA